jgi:phospholipid-binding lipoprotein MlaA
MKLDNRSSPRRSGGRAAALALLLVAGAGLSGCATNNPKDPLEHFNRAMFTFNDVVDKTALKPAATVYQTVLPSFVQTGVGNFFGNLADVWTTVNDVLQGKGQAGLTDMMRVAVNSTLGLGGLLDIGSEAGLPKHKEDFGQTLGKWGVHSGPYVVLPLFGPSTMRDSLALPVDLGGDPWSYVKPTRLFVAGSVVRVVDQRAAVLDASNLIEEAALDKYEFFRDAYLQRRESKINDGESPRQQPGKKTSLNTDASGEPVAQVNADVTAEVTATTKADAKAGLKPEVKAAPDVSAAQAGLPVLQTPAASLSSAVDSK